MRNTETMSTAIYNIKTTHGWKQVRATSMSALNNWAKENGVTDWRMAGMMSRAELADSKKLEVVA